SLFQTTSDKVIKDRTAIFIGRLFRAHEISDKKMQQSTISYLKSITSDADEWTRSNSALAINYLAYNEDNYTEIMKGFDPLAIIQDLALPIVGNEEERKQIQHKKNLDCVLLQLIIYKVEDDNTILQNLIEAGIIEALLYFFETQDLNMITYTSLNFFYLFQYLSKTQIEQLKKEKKYYPNILRLFGSSDLEVIREAYFLTAFDIENGAYLAKDNSQNPLFEEISECGGIEIIFDLFQRNLNYDTREQAANLLTWIFVNKEFSNALMRKELVNYYTNPLINGNTDEQEIDESNLTDLARIAENHEEILKDDFITKAAQIMSNSSTTFLLDFLEIIINVGTEKTREQIKQEFPVAYIKELYQHKDSNIREKAFLFMVRINYPEQMKKLESYQSMIKKNRQDQQTNFNIHEVINDVCIAIEEASGSYDEKGGLALIGIRIVRDLIKYRKGLVQQELVDGRFIEQIFKLFEIASLPQQILYEIFSILPDLISISFDARKLVQQEKNIRSIIHLLDNKVENSLLDIIQILSKILLSVNQQIQIKQENEIRDVFEKCGGLIQLFQIFQNYNNKNKLVVQHSIISIGLLHKAVKVPDEMRTVLIREIKSMPQPGNDKEIQYLSAIVLSMLAESEQNHTDIIAGGFPNIISRLLIHGDQKIQYEGLTLALNMIYFGSEQTKQKVKQVVPLSTVRQLTQIRDENAAMTAQLLIAWLQFLS
ncbi:MAG: hypothetical protein EZS28_024225, partial [Streblomastix strix]